MRKLKVGMRNKIKSQKELGYLEIDGVKEKVLDIIESGQRVSASYIKIGGKVIYHSGSSYFNKCVIYNCIFSTKIYLALNLEADVQSVLDKHSFYAPELEYDMFKAYVNSQVDPIGTASGNTLVPIDSDSVPNTTKYATCMFNGVFDIVANAYDLLTVDPMCMPKLYDGALRIFATELTEYMSEHIDVQHSIMREKYKNIPEKATNVLTYILARLYLAEETAKKYRQITTFDMAKNLRDIRIKIQHFYNEALTYFNGQTPGDEFLRSRIGNLSMLLADSEDWDEVHSYVESIHPDDLLSTAYDLEELMLSRLNIKYQTKKTKDKRLNKQNILDIRSVLKTLNKEETYENSRRTKTD
jgi:hypothetical protein